MTTDISVFFSLSTLFVVIAAFLDIGANLMLASSNGFRRYGYGFCALILAGGAFYCLSLAVREMDLAVAYALWGSFGILGTSLGAWLLFKQNLKPIAFAGMAILIAGIFLLRFE